MSLFRRKKNNHRSRPAARGRGLSVRRLPLSLEVLEDRTLLSTVDWIGQSGNWDAGPNWKGGKAPGAGDTAVINTSAAATITIQSGDNIQVQAVTTGSNDTLSITGGSLKVTSGTSTLSGALSMTGGSLTANGSGVKLTANGSTTVADASLYAKGGATLSLPKLTSYTGAGSSPSLQADGAGSVLDVSALSSITRQSSFLHLYATNKGELKLTGLTSLDGNAAAGGQTQVQDSGTLLDSNLATITGNVAVTTDGSDPHLADAWTKFTGSALTVTGGSFVLPGLTDVDDSSLFVQSGASLALPGLKSYTGAGSNPFLQADGAGSVLDVSALSSITRQSGYLHLYATNKGELKLTGLTSLDGNASAGGQTQVQDSGTLLDSNLATITGNVAVTTDGSDPHLADAWTKFINSNLDVTGGSPLFPKLTDFSGSNLQVGSGAVPSFPGLTNGSITLSNGESVNIQSTLVSLPADGTSGATINVPSSQGMTITLKNSGTLTGTTFNVGQGTTVLLAGGTYKGTTTLKVAQGATVDLTGGQTTTCGGTLTGSGAGTVAFSNGQVAPALGGLTLNFPGSMFQWTGGIIDTSVGDVTNKGTMNLAGSNDKEIFNDGTLDNFGTIIQTGSGNLGLHGDGKSPTTLLNEAGASYLIESDSGIDNPFGKQTAVRNAGTIRKTAGSGTSQLYINGALSNTGVIEADAGTLFLDANSISQVSGTTLTAGTWSALNGATLEFPSGTSITTNEATVNLGGSGATIAALAGLASNSGSFSVTNGATFTTAGDLSNSGSLTVGAGSTITVAGNCTQTSAGTLNVQIAGTPASDEFGQLVVQKAANLGGNFNVNLPSGFTPPKNAVYQVMTYASASGTFAQVTGLGPDLTEQINPTGLDLVYGTGAPVALQLSAVTAPTAATTGQSIAVNWTVNNAGSTAANGNWQDSVYLSTTAAITSSSVLLGSVTHTGGLAAGASYKASLPAAVPAVPPGNYYVLVQADSLDQVLVTNRAKDTLAASTGSFTISVPALTLGTPSKGTFTAADQDQYYQITVPAGGSLQVQLTSAASSGALALYASEGTQPTPYNYQESANVAGQPNQSLTVPLPGAGTYYILVHSVSGAAATAGYTLSVTQTNALTVSAISSYSGGNTGNVTIEIDGANFTPQTTASLTLGSTTIDASAIDFVSASQLFATFDLSGAAPGSYTLSVQQGSQSVAAPTPFQVVAATPSNGLLAVTLGLPQYIRDGRTGTLVITYTNTTANDIVAPLLQVTTTNSGVLFSTPDDPNNYVSSAQVLAVAPSGPAGILRPGQSGQLTVTLLLGDIGDEQVPISVKQVLPGQTIDWASQKTALQPSTFSDAAWNVVWNNLTATLGTTSDSYTAALAKAATYLGSLGETPAEVSDVNRLWSFLVAQANASFPSATLASAVDASLSVPGTLSLSIGRTFVGTIAGRYQESIFGLGWVPSWQASLSTDAAGNVSINTGSALAYFVRQSNGTYLDTDGEFGTLIQSGGVYTFTSTSGTRYVFLANGNLNYEQDTNGNRITLGYNSQNQLVTLTYSNPADPSEPTEQLTLTYYTTGPNAGLVQSVTDGTGKTWTYNYDSGNHLTSVVAPGTGPSGNPGTLTTSYTYDTGSIPETANALLSITRPDGSEVNYTYDPATGRLTGTSQNGGANPVTYAYPGEAEVTATDAGSNQSTVWYNDLGLAARVEDPRGGISTYAYNTNGNLVSYTDAAGDTYQYSYDTNGNLTRTVNPLGQTVQMTYGPLSKLTSITDAAGHTTQYQYSAAGNLLSIAYPSGSQQSFTYDPLGNLSETVLQNGDPIGYQYNPQGLVSQETFADGSYQTFKYDANGNLLLAKTYNAGGTLIGTTTLTYNAANELLSITYPNGHYLTFTYDSTTGQRTQSVDQSGYTVNYTYDSLGRLYKLTDGSKNLIVQYTYNNLGQLATKVNGNGTSTVYGYDQAGNLTSIVNYAADGKTVNSSFTYKYNLLNETTQVTDAAGHVTKFGYDAIGQLTQVTLPDGTTITYVYNAAGDRTEVLTNGTPTSYASNADNEITQVGSTIYTYDQKGNLHTATDASGTTTYTYNDLNQLVSITAPDGSTTTFQYSPLGFLVGMSTTTGSTTSQTNYLVDPTGLGNVVASYDGSGSLIAHYNYGLGLVSQTGPSGTGYYDFDTSGNTVGITGSNGTYVNQYSYQPFGQTTVVSAALPNPFTFAGQTGVMQITANLLYMRARDYTPATGQFTSQDPIGLNGGDTNIRRYAVNDPIDYEDPLGTSAGALIGGFAGGVFGGTVGAISGAVIGVQNALAIQRVSPVPLPTGVLAGIVVKDTGKGALTGASVGATLGATIGSQIPGFGDGGPGSGGSGPAGGGSGSAGSGGGLPGGFPGGGGANGGTGGASSHDPNALIGPTGYGSQGYVQPGGTWSYTVDFENDGSAAAQTVTVTEQLDSNLDWSTFQLGSFGFGSVKVAIPAGLTQYQTTVAYHNPDGTSLNVNVNLDFNVQTGLLTVTFTSIDPQTGQAPNGVLDGFLPPNNVSGIGEGFVQYSVQPKTGLASGTALNGQASVVFDTNAAIQTNQVVNTIDTAPPTSSVNPLPATASSPNFTVGWSGRDSTGPGIASYSIYVSDNGGAFTPWLTGTTATSATFSGQNGHSYSFYSVATDALGLVQATPAGAQAATFVSLPPPPPPPPQHQVPPPPPLSVALSEGLQTLEASFAVDGELPQIIGSAGPGKANDLLFAAFGLIEDELALLKDVVTAWEAPYLGMGPAQSAALSADIVRLVADIDANPLVR